MADFIVLRLTPATPVDGATFTNYLTGLTINVYDISFDHPQAGMPGDPTPPIGSAAYNAPTFEPFPAPIPPPPFVSYPAGTTIVQHFAPVVNPLAGTVTGVNLHSVATAVIPYVPPGPEYPSAKPSPDLRVQFQRGGAQTVVDANLYYDVTIHSAGGAPTPEHYQGLAASSVSAYVTLPAALNPNIAQLPLPADGSLPNFNALLAAINLVLASDPNAGQNLAALIAANRPLTLEQSRHIAYEIVWGALPPLPPPPDLLEEMYTNPPNDGNINNENEQSRRRFDGELNSYYATRNANIERLAGFVYAASAALVCAKLSREASRVEFFFPVIAGVTDSSERVQEVKVILKSPPAVPPTPLNPAFEVPAAYFFALGAIMSSQITPEQRYQMATLDAEPRVLGEFKRAISVGVISAPPITPEQAARRLNALGVSGAVSQEVVLTPSLPTSPLQNLVQAWLDSVEADIALFWAAAMMNAAHRATHFDLVLIVLTENHAPLMTAIKTAPLPWGAVSDAEGLRNKSVAQWRELLRTNPNVLLPDFTSPGSAEQRIASFIRHVRKFFEVHPHVGDADAPVVGGPPSLRRSLSDPLQQFIDHYNTNTNPDFAFGAVWNPGSVANALNDVFPTDPSARAWLEQTLQTINDLFVMADVGLAELRFSVMEALYARGFSSKQSVQGLSLEELQEALTGTVAYAHAASILRNAGGIPIPGQPGAEGFKPINPDGLLTNCIPPPHLSPLGPVAYLNEMLNVSQRSTCEDPLPRVDEQQKLKHLLDTRRGRLGDLSVSRTNLETPLPLIDLVNECLEAIAVNLPTGAGVIYNTAVAELGGHKLQALGANAGTSQTEFRHEPETLFEALPEHSSPAVPVKEPDAYDELRSVFTAPLLPYSQPLDINRSYLRQLGTSRYAVMRRFRKEITEFVLDPNAFAANPADFQSNLWRYPVRIEIAREYLGITPEEHDLLFTKEIVEAAGGGGNLVLMELYGFAPRTPEAARWMEIVVKLPEFLERTGLTYCQFIELWKSEFVRFRRAGEDREFPDCEPCYTDKYRIQFETPETVVGALKKLAVFIRLWRKLQAVDNARYSFAQLRDICQVLRLFNDDGTINPDFIRQLAAFQLLRDHFGLALTDGTNPQPGDTGAARTHLLALWVGPAASKWEWAVDHLLDHLYYYAQARHKCACRLPDFIKLLAENLRPLSRLAGFDPDNPADTWHARPTHTLRFAEVLAKIYASDFGIGEVLFLFTADEHVEGDDPFPLPPRNEAFDSPLDLPDDTDEFSLWALREKLLTVDVADEEAQSWSWARLETSLRTEFGYAHSEPGPDPLLSLGEHYFPNMLGAEGYPVDVNRRQYRVGLAVANPVPLLWNTPPDGPFRYDAANGQLWTQLPLTDEAVIAKLSRIRQLNAEEQRAVQELYFLPRVDLAPFALIFANFPEAEERLIQEADEARRWAYFQRAFAHFHARAQVIAEHLTGHVAAATGQKITEGAGLAWRLLQHLFADENKADLDWELDNGQVPEVTWKPQPNGGAFAALLGLMGTGLLGEFTPEGQALIWREVRGPLDAFGPEENAANSPIPTVIPALGLTLTRDQERFARVRNGFALSNPDGALLGGAQGFTVRWRGVLLVENDGAYEFRAGSPTAEGEEPDFAAARHSRWRVTLRRGQKLWVLLNHHWPGENAPAACSEPLQLKRGAYRLTVEFVQPQPAFDGPEDACQQTSGFQLKYSGPDSDDQLSTIPLSRLYRDIKSPTLADQIENPIGNAARRFLELHYTSTLRDVRRTYQRAFKALLFAHRFGLSAQPLADDGQSELGYMLAHKKDKANFFGTSYFRAGGGFSRHRAYFNFNFLPVLDNYYPPPPPPDQRAAPSVKRRQALFDWWERVFDYTAVRREAQTAPERPLWLLFHEAAEAHPDDPAHLLRHMGVDFRHAALVLRYYPDYDVTNADLEDERWAVRVWQAEKWIRALLLRFFVRDIRDARPDLWAADDPILDPAGPAPSGNANLTEFFRAGSIENGAPRRYEEIKRLNDGLRERARQALLAYLCGMNRVLLPWSEFADEPKDLSELLLLDVEAGLCQRASRIEEAISAVQIFIQRARLGLEPDFVVTPEFLLLWERRFVTFHVWEACKRREIYRENWIEWDELLKARRSEAFRFLEDQLRRATLTVPVPGGLEYWPDQRPPLHPGLTLLQAREPSMLRLLPPAGAGSQPAHGFDLLGTPERHARPSWLAALSGEGQTTELPSDDSGGLNLLLQQNTSQPLPFWLEAAIRLGVQFVRVAAAGEPPAATTLAPRHPERDQGCCVECGRQHPALVDEYYFWLFDSRYYTEVPQDADWGVVSQDPAARPAESDWHKADQLPKLLHWESLPMVHLAWCRVHNGEFQQPRRSFEGVRVSNSDPQLLLLGRTGDSLNFQVPGGLLPPGYSAPPNPGFRYDLATDTAVVLPLVAAPPAPPTFPGGLQAYPYFAYFESGAPVTPPSLFSPALSVAGSLRAHCRFEAALKWYELVFNPLREDLTWSQCPREREGGSVFNRPPGEIPTQPPTDGELIEGPAGEEGNENPTGGVLIVVAEGEEAACCQNSVVTDEVARDRSITLHYLETLLHWGDALMRRNAPEAFQQARLIYDTAAKLLGIRPQNILDVDVLEPPQTVATFDPHFAPLNPRLLALYDLVEDRLGLIHACLNARRLRNGRPNKDMPYWGNHGPHSGGPLTAQECRSWQPADHPCADDEDWCCVCSPYRFLFLVQKAQELANEVRGLGAALLAAYEKGDGEYLASLRASHERQLLNLALEIRQNQWREADWQAQALGKTKEIAQTRRRYYATLIQNDLNSEELQYQSFTAVALGLRSAGNIAEAVAQALNIVPDPYVGFPCSFTHLPGGTKVAAVFSVIARISNTLADIAGTTASLRLTEAGWTRREEEWRHQVEVLDIEIEQIERQILAAERRRHIALRELNNHQRQMEHAAEMQDFLRDKFTNHALFLWLQKETAALHYQMYELALHTARQAQRAFNYERGHTTRKFLPAEIWDNLHEGLLAGERLHLAIRQMEKAYLCENLREYELTKHVSLRLHFPLAYLLLRATGNCEIEIPEWMFDLDYPGQYLRRIKNVTITLPSVVGPYSGVHCRLTLLSSATRIDPRLSDPPSLCCEDDAPDNDRLAPHCGPHMKAARPRAEDRPLHNGYRVRPDDPRIVTQYAATEAIATSSGQNDAGMFEVSFRDERYLPFEFAGAVSRWRIELPQENNQFDVDTLSDVILHLNYTAREGGERLRRAANEIAQEHLPGAGIRFFDVRHELPDAWQLFQHCPADPSVPPQLGLRLSRNMFPFLPGRRDVWINRLELFFEATGAEPSVQRLVEFLVGHRIGHTHGERCDCEARDIYCIASAQWPGLYHGVLDVNLGPLGQNGYRDLGTFIFPPDVGEVARVFLFCSYHVA